MTKTDSEQAFAPRPRAPKGYRPADLGPAHIEHVLSIAMTTAAEVSVLHDKLDTLMRIAVEKPTFSLQDIENYEPSPAVAAERTAWRKDYLARLLRSLHEEIPEESASSHDGYAAFVEEISN